VSYICERCEKSRSGANTEPRLCPDCEEAGYALVNPGPPVVVDLECTYAFVVPGPPVGKERARTVTVKSRPVYAKGRLIGSELLSRRTYTPKKTRDYEKKVGLCARAAGVRVLASDVSAALTIEMSDTVARKDWPDGDNVEKVVLDGLKGVGYRDDGQVVSSRWKMQAVRGGESKVVVSLSRA
jgi:Holliday junction resolvase RusA-like endonuclease